jgi:translation initiation factor 1A
LYLRCLVLPNKKNKGKKMKNKTELVNCNYVKMTKNTIGGKGHKRGKNQTTTTRQIPFRDTNGETDYAYVLDMLGNGRIKVVCYRDGKERIGTIRGNMYKRVWICRDDIVLVGLRDFQDDRCDVMYKYNQDEVRLLCRKNELPDNYVSRAKKEFIHNANEEDGAVFAVEDDIDIEAI